MNTPDAASRLQSAAARAWIARLSALLPAAEAERVRTDVEAMILDHAEAACSADPALDPAEAERLALESLGSPEDMADALVDRPVRVTWATWRSVQRMLWVLVPCHVLLSVVLTAAGSTTPALPGLLGPLPTSSWAATALAVFGVLVVDVGLVVLLHAVFGAHLGRIRPLGDPRLSANRGDAVRRLVFLALVAVLVNGLLKRLFTVEFASGEAASFLVDDVLALVPWANVVLALFALRDVAALVRPASARALWATDTLASAAAAILLVVAASRPELVRFPADRLGPPTASLLTSLVTRLFVFLFVVGALVSALRAVGGIRRLLATRSA
ncbi:MAG: hypothetical protein H6806_11425 [Planctomycetes bacterium]|nr:hypothetical protein [Planctomycetota bacterium]MCB9825559.1 hypothetical protein [Planctomycetota bacterium]MCB9830353.1 hypothetical protein [Planctomycetota bacterium]MCB9900653.1 hypothetical protein [Planctomycetota bacterium]